MESCIHIDAVLLTKSFLPRKSQANYLEHDFQVKPKYFSNDTKMSTATAEGCIFVLLQALHHYCMEWGLHPLHPKIFNGYSQVSHIQGHPKCLRKHEAQQGLQATFRANLSVIFSRSNILKGSEYLLKAPSLSFLLAKQTTISKVL